MVETDTKSAQTKRWQLNIISVSAIAGLVALLVMGLVEILLVLRDVGYNPVVESISSLGLRSLGWLQTISFLLGGLLIEVFTIGLYLDVRRNITSQLSAGILVFFGFGLLLIAAFKTQPAGAPQSIEGLIHSATARTVFLLFPLVCFLLVPSLRADNRWKNLFVYNIVAGALGAIFVVIWLVFSTRINWFGLYERILFANATIWLGVMAVQLLRLSLREGWRIVKVES
ncbi:DUF998 domain-containing protein [Chloroflexota bacterium]